MSDDKTDTLAEQESPEEVEIPWPQIVDAMYNGVQIKHLEIGHWRMIPEDNQLSANMNKADLTTALEYLQRHNLIEEVGTSGVMVLTELGMQVAHGRVQTQRQQKTNRAVALFTFVLVLIEIVANIPNSDYRLLGTLIVLIGVVAVAAHTDILDFSVIDVSL